MVHIFQTMEVVRREMAKPVPIRPHHRAAFDRRKQARLPPCGRLRRSRRGHQQQTHRPVGPRMGDPGLPSHPRHRIAPELSRRGQEVDSGVAASLQRPDLGAVEGLLLGLGRRPSKAGLDGQIARVSG